METCGREKTVVPVMILSSKSPAPNVANPAHIMNLTVPGIEPTTHASAASAKSTTTGLENAWRAKSSLQKPWRSTVLT